MVKNKLQELGIGGLSAFIVHDGFCKGMVDTICFIEKEGNDIISACIYIEDIILVLLIKAYVKSSRSVCMVIWNDYDGRVQVLSWLQIKQPKEDIFMNQTKYTVNTYKA